MSAIAILSPVGIDTQPVRDSIIGCHWVKGTEGVYIADWWTNADLSMVPDSNTVQNLTVGNFTKEFAIGILQSGKALVIHGLTDMDVALSTFGLTRCDENGIVLEDEII